MQSAIRKSGKVTDVMPIAIVLTVVFVITGQLLFLSISGINPYDSKNGLSAPVNVFLMYFQFIGIWLIFLLAMLLPKSNRPMLKDLLPSKDGNTVKKFLLGALLGLGMNALCIFISLLLKDLAFSFDNFHLGWLLLIFLAVLIQSGAEEIACRLYLYEKLRRRYTNPWLAIFISAVTFSALHIFNPGITVPGMIQILLVGILLSILVFYYNSLWAAIAVHTAWNYTQNILFGLPNSGIVSQYSLFRVDAASDGPFFDVTFGVEGSIGGCAVLFIVCICLFLYARRKGLAPVDRWAAYDQ